MSETNPKRFKEVATNYRREMSSYLDQIILIIKRKRMSPEEFANFRVDEEKFRSKEMESAQKLISYQWNLLLTKAHIHLMAILYANKSSNIHSLAIHARIVLECAGQIVWLQRMFVIQIK